MEISDIEIEVEDPVKKIEELRKKATALKIENEKLKKENTLLLRNNKNLVYLVEILEERIKKLNEDMLRNYIYSYERGGWILKDDADPRKLEVFNKREIRIEDINEQLEEILRLIEKHKKRL